MPNELMTEAAARAEAIGQLSAQDAQQQRPDPCGPEPQRPTYFSPQNVRDRWIEWQLCKATNGGNIPG